MKVFFGIMFLISLNANAGWFDFMSKTKELSAKEKEIVKDGICGCWVGAGAMYVTTISGRQYEDQIRPVMSQMHDSLAKTYDMTKPFTCKDWGGPQQARGRKVCIATYSNFGDDRSLKAQGESLK